MQSLAVQTTRRLSCGPIPCHDVNLRTCDNSLLSTPTSNKQPTLWPSVGSNDLEINETLIMPYKTVKPWSITRCTLARYEAFSCRPSSPDVLVLVLDPTNMCSLALSHAIGSATRSRRSSRGYHYDKWPLILFRIRLITIAVVRGLLSGIDSSRLFASVAGLVIESGGDNWTAGCTPIPICRAWNKSTTKR